MAGSNALSPRGEELKLFADTPSAPPFPSQFLRRLISQRFAGLWAEIRREIGGMAVAGGQAEGSHRSLSLFLFTFRRLER